MNIRQTPPVRCLVHGILLLLAACSENEHAAATTGVAFSTLSSTMTSGTRPPQKAGQCSVWDAANARMIVFGGGVTTVNGEFWTLTFSGTQGTWAYWSPA